jgi:ribonuclease J
MDVDGLHLVPLGGTGEIGMNLNAYHHAGRWLLVDCGVMFERQDAHRQHVLFPDVSFLEDKRDRIEGLLITHAHQDHLGAVADLWPALRCRVYGTRFAIEMLKGPLGEAGLKGDVPLKVIPSNARLQLGPFDIQRIGLTHSTVEMSAFVLRTEAGTVLHTGDWKLDAAPQVGPVSDEPALRALADETIHACVSDSTNAHEEGWTPSEGSLVAPLSELIAGRTGRIAVALFSSNVARLQTLHSVAKAHGREIVLLGRSLHKTVRAARAAGYLRDFTGLVDPQDFGFLPRDRVLILCTGSQGEPRAGLTRLAEDSHRGLYLEAGDTVIFSARKIPGCELPVERVHRLLRDRGIEVVSADDAAVHVSGHPRREELRTLYDWVQPEVVVPVHGTPMHLEAHAQLAESMGLWASRIRNGHVLQLGATTAIVDTVPTGRVRRVEKRRGEPPSSR